MAREPKSSIYCIQDSTRTQISVCTKQKETSNIFRPINKEITAPNFFMIDLQTTVHHCHQRLVELHRTENIILFFVFFSDPTFVFETVT